MNVVVLIVILPIIITAKFLKVIYSLEMSILLDTFAILTIFSIFTTIVVCALFSYVWSAVAQLTECKTVD